MAAHRSTLRGLGLLGVAVDERGERGWPCIADDAVGVDVVARGDADPCMPQLVGGGLVALPGGDEGGEGAAQHPRADRPTHDMPVSNSSAYL